MNVKTELLPDRDALAARAADVIAEALAAPGPHSLIVTGGGTPGPAYDALAARDLDWARITVTLSDDRWVEAVSPLSNEGLVRGRLLTGKAAAASFLALKGVGATPHEDAAAAEPGLAALLPSAAVLLGMGEDAHIASLFPGADYLAAALDPDGARLCIGIDHAGLDPRVPRISLTARALLATGLVVLMITGEAKRVIVERVLADADYNPPVAAILRQDKTPVRVLWAA